VSIFTKIFGDPNEKQVKQLSAIAARIEALDTKMSVLSDGELREYTFKFKKRLEDGATLDDILPEAFAVAREAAWRVLGMKPFKVQLMGGIALHEGRIAEMRTGEGKTLVATLPAYLNALTGKGVHIVTVNDYLAKRDSQWMGKIFTFLGLEVGLIVHGLSYEERKKSYACDITYGTNNELGFDYLRDNMVRSKEAMVQRELNYAIIDEVDSILIDEARTPLIISGPGDKSTSMYQTVDRVISRLKKGDWDTDEKEKNIFLTDEGIKKVEYAFKVDNLSDPENVELSHHVQQALKANFIMKRDVDYVVRDGEVVIVDEFTGRLMQGRRYSDGLHQAIEAKENVKVERESKTLATVTFQNYFRMYKKLCGMTGTAKTEEEEFRGIYSLDVVTIPTNLPMQRVDQNDAVYTKLKYKYAAIVADIEDCAKRGQPVLVGTVSVEKSEFLSKLIKAKGIKHNVLNAKNHEREAEIVAQAGRFGAVTIATNMAGRGTDIILGGNPETMAKQELKRLGVDEDLIARASGHEASSDEELMATRARLNELIAEYKKETLAEKEKVLAVGGLRIIGTERHESRRIDNQLRGRAGRQGDPGSSKFYLSFEDDLMRRFGGERMAMIMQSFNLDTDMPVDMAIMSRQIESAQKKVESVNYASRKHVLEYDDVMNKQREIIYSQRRMVLEGENVHDFIMGMLEDLIDEAVDTFWNDGGENGPDLNSLTDYLEQQFLPRGLISFTESQIATLTSQSLKEAILKEAKEEYARHEEANSPEAMRSLERQVLLQTVDRKWMDHIDDMASLREGISLRALAQRDPVVEYKREGFDMFDEMTYAIKQETVKLLFAIRVVKEGVPPPTRQAPIPAGGVNMPKKSDKKPGRNDPCPCGSGKKYKQCCGKNEA